MPQIFLKNPFAKKLLAKFHGIPLFGENFCVSSGTNIFPFSKTKRLGQPALVIKRAQNINQRFSRTIFN